MSATFQKSNLLLHWIWAAAQTPGVEFVALTSLGQPLVFAQGDLPRHVDALSKFKSTYWVNKSYSLSGSARQMTIAAAPIHLFLVGRFAFWVPLSEGDPLPPRMMPLVTPESATRFWPLGFPNSVPTEVTTEVFDLRVQNNLPMLPCKWLATDCVNESGGWMRGRIELVDATGFPEYVGDDPGIGDVPPHHLSERQIQILMMLYEAEAFGKGNLCTRDDLITEEDSATSPTTISKSAKKLVDLNLVKSTPLGFYLLAEGIEYCKRWIRT